VLDELHRRDGKTILLATHNLQEAETMADRIAILVEGRVREIGTVDQVRRWGLQGRRFTLEVDPDAAEIRGPFRVLYDETTDDRRKVTVSLEDGVGFEDVIRSLLDAGVRVHACDRDDPDLEKAFARILEAEQRRA
jgi:ABC-2 type transport system ATP-binding protein